jgi:hypothetical protein
MPSDFLILNIFLGLLNSAKTLERAAITIAPSADIGNA